MRLQRASTTGANDMNVRAAVRRSRFRELVRAVDHRFGVQRQ